MVAEASPNQTPQPEQTSSMNPADTPPEPVAPAPEVQPPTTMPAHEQHTGGTMMAVWALGAVATASMFGGFRRRRAEHREARRQFTKEAAQDIVSHSSGPPTYRPGVHFVKTTLKTLPGEPGHYVPAMDEARSVPNDPGSGNPSSVPEAIIAKHLDRTMRAARNARMKAAPHIALYGEDITDPAWVEERIATGRFTAAQAYRIRRASRRVRSLLAKAERLESKVRQKAEGAGD